MRRPWTRSAVGAVVGVAMVIGLGGVSVANTARFTFIMQCRYVGGDKTGVTHVLDAGELTLSGAIWITDKRLANPATEPATVTIELMQGDHFKTSFCSVEVTPDRIFNRRTNFSKSCGRIEAGTYWVRVWKKGARDKDGDGWHSQGDGILTVK